MEVSIVPHADGAPMIGNPQAVAMAMRAMIAKQALDPEP